MIVTGAIQDRLNTVRDLYHYLTYNTTNTTGHYYTPVAVPNRIPWSPVTNTENTDLQGTGHDILMKATTQWCSLPIWYYDPKDKYSELFSVECDIMDYYRSIDPTNASPPTSSPVNVKKYMQYIRYYNFQMVDAYRDRIQLSDRTLVETPDKIVDRMILILSKNPSPIYVTAATRATALTNLNTSIAAWSPAYQAGHSFFTPGARSVLKSGYYASQIMDL